MASKVAQLKGLLEQMVEAAEKKDITTMRRLNYEFERAMPSLSDISQQFIDYDNCRQSCVMALNFTEMYDKFMADAKKRWTEINCGRAPQDKYA